MSVKIGRRLRCRLLLAPLLFAACGPRASDQGSPQVLDVQTVSTEPGEIELFEPKVTLTAPNLIQFEVGYRFTKGKPDKYYLCEIAFPGTTNHGAKPMERWELKPQGVIKDGIILSKPPVQTFEIRMSEAVSPQNGYKKNSNVVMGPVE
jgi:hypothetical protein